MPIFTLEWFQGQVVRSDNGETVVKDLPLRLGCAVGLRMRRLPAEAMQAPLARLQSFQPLPSTFPIDTQLRDRHVCQTLLHRGIQPA